MTNDELMLGMKDNLKVRVVSREQQYGEALAHLDAAAEAFDKAENVKFATLTTNLLIRLAKG